jgi:hypothetical protein
MNAMGGRHPELEPLARDAAEAALGHIGAQEALQGFGLLGQLELHPGAGERERALFEQARAELAQRFPEDVALLVAAGSGGEVRRLMVRVYDAHGHITDCFARAVELTRQG